MTRAISIGLLGATCLVVAEPAEHGSPRVLHRLSLDGTLSCAIEIRLDSKSNDRGLPVHLQHQVERDATGRARSMWLFGGVSGFAILEPDGRWTVEVPGRPPLRLADAVDHPGSELLARNGGALLRNAGPGRLVLMRGPEFSAVFQDGILTEWQESGARFVVTGQGARITSIRKAGSTDFPEWRASYRPTGEPVEISWGDQKIWFEYSTDLQLRGVMSASKRCVVRLYQFEYANGLIVSLELGGRKVGPIRWRAPSLLAPAAAWKPVLIGDGEFTYWYRSAHGMVAMRSRNVVTGEREFLHYNLFTAAWQQGKD